MLNLSVTGTAHGQQLNAQFTQGDVVAWAFTGTNNGTAINLTGSTIKITIGFPQPLFLSTATSGITITNAADGQFSVNLDSTTTAGFTPGAYNYDLWIESQVYPPIETQYITGTIFVNQSITEVP